MKRYKLILFFIIFFGVLTVDAQPATINKHDARVIRLINSLPEVREAGKYVIKTTKGKRHLTTMIDSWPTKEDSNYTVAVVEFNGSNLVPHFRFYVNPKTDAIRCWNHAMDKIISLKAWRKERIQKKKR